MDFSYQENDKENSERRNSNTEYLPTKCRITRPPPPKPATNPLQFIKVATPPLFQKAQEQIKKVEEIRSIRQEIKDDGEDWQQNLDNWKSSRRKRQEHIIERVVEVKKLTQEEQEKSRRKSKTFNEILEERSKRGHRLKLPIYEDDDDNDFTSYGIGSSNSKTEPEKIIESDNINNTVDSKNQNNISNKDKSTENQSENKTDNDNINKNFNSKKCIGHTIKKENINNKSIFADENVESKIWLNTYTQNLYSNKPKIKSKPFLLDSKISYNNNNNNNNQDDTKLDNMQQYTYEGAIEGYRTRIRSKINVDESIFSKPLEHNRPTTDVDVLIPKGALFKRKEIFEMEKPIEIGHLESTTSKRLSEDFVNSQSIKERLKSLEKCTEQSLTTSIETNSKMKLGSFGENNPKTIGSFLIDKSNSTSSMESKNSTNKPLKFNHREEIIDRSSSPETELYMNKLNMFNKDLDALLEKTNNRGLDSEMEYYSSPNYPPSSSSADVALSSDREDSGIHTADVSCSVSQADESAEDNDLFSSTIPGCIEKLNREKERELEQLKELEQLERLTSKMKIKELEEKSEDTEDEIKNNRVDCFDSYKEDQSSKKVFDSDDCYFQGDVLKDPEETKSEMESKENTITLVEYPGKTRSDTDFPFLISQTSLFLEELKEDAAANFKLEKEWQISNIKKTATIEVSQSVKNVDSFEPIKTMEKKAEIDFSPLPITNHLPIYENVDIRPNTTFLLDDVNEFSAFPLAPPKAVEPPKEKPPPPPPLDQDGYHERPKEAHVKRLNSAKRIKKELHVKRSSFLGLDEPTDDQIDPDIIIERPPDINSFLQKESQLEKSLYRKLHGSREGISEVESQDSGLESERGRLSSDTWCSNATSTHIRQDSEQTNSVTSEEDEITKKEREIIELVEKEEKTRNSIAYSKGNNVGSISSDSPSFDPHSYSNSIEAQDKYHNNLQTNNENYNLMLSDTDSEVMKVEQELRQLEQEEMERRKENNLFREARAKIRNQNSRHSLENICDLDIYPRYSDSSNRKSLPDISHDVGLPIKCCKSASHIPALQYQPAPEAIHRKSMPDIKQMYSRSRVEHENVQSYPLEHRKSMPELQENYRAPATFLNNPISNQPSSAFSPKLIKPYPNEQRKPDKHMLLDYVESETFHPTNGNDKKQGRQLSRHGLHALSAAPKPKHIPNDNWIQPKANPEVKNYNQHWLFQEAELRRIQDQQKNSSLQNRQNWQWPSRQEKHIPEPIIQTLTQRIQNRASQNDRHQLLRRSQPPAATTKDFARYPYVPTHPHSHNLGHGVLTSYSSPIPLEESQSKLLSVSGKKKCSYCGSELGRGAAMIIESLCLFYHMECFKCCVCHVQLGDGLMGTDVRVRNQKLHCHNCYLSDDGVKFSCV